MLQFISPQDEHSHQKEKKKTDKMSVICLGYPGTCATKPGWFDSSMRKVQGIP